MLFSDLMESRLEEGLKDTVRQLLDLKMSAQEVKMIPRIGVLNEYLDRSITGITEKIKRLPKERPREWEELNELFLSALEM